MHIRFEPIESELLQRLFSDLAEVVEGDALEADDPVRRRLYPAGYRDDPEAAADFRELTEASLRAEQANRARACAGDVSAGRDVVLDEDAADRWIRTLNDVRLALGVRLDITDEGDAEELAEQVPVSQEFGVYNWLTGLQDTLVRRLMG